MASPIIRAATREDIASFSKLADGLTMRAILIEKDGRILAMGGVIRREARWYAYCDLVEEARIHKMTLMRAGKKMVEMLKAMGIRQAYAYPDPNEPRSMQWLMSLGFVPDTRVRDLYRWKA